MRRIIAAASTGFLLIASFGSAGAMTPAELQDIARQHRLAGVPITPLPTLNIRTADSCCKHCSKGQPCGNSCISREKQCHKGKGCAC